MPINLKVGILIKRRGKLLLIHERQTETSKLKWNIVKGTVDPSDRTLTAAAIREVREEVGLRIHPAGILNIAQRLRRKHPVVQVNFLATSMRGAAKVSSKKFQQSLNEDITEIRWFTRAELKKLKLKDCMNDRVTQAIRLWLQRKHD